MNSISIQYFIGNNYKDIIKSRNYESIILKIMNNSKFIFKDEYDQILEQSNNESDFKNKNKDEYFDAKILFENEICQNIDKKNISDWLLKFSQNTQEEYDALMSGSCEEDILEKIYKTKLYIEFKDRIGKIKDGENCILFLPFPLTLEFEESLIVHFTSSIYHLVIRTMMKKEKHFLKKNQVFIIYPNIENKIVLRRIFDGVKVTYDIEFLSDYYFHEYIKIMKIGN